MSSPVIGDVAYRIAEQLKRTTDEHQELALLALIDAMAAYREHQFWFNETNGNIEIYPDQINYARTPSAPTADTGYFPADLVKPLRPWITEYVGGRAAVPTVFEDRLSPMQNKTLDYVEYYRGVRSHRGRPFAYTFYGDEFRVTPIPDRDFQVRLNYIKDLGVPYYARESDAWKFYDPSDGSELDPANWTSDWLLHAEALLRFRAKYQLYANVYEDLEKARVQKELENEALRDLSKASNNFDSQLRQGSDWGGDSRDWLL